MDLNQVKSKPSHFIHITNWFRFFFYYNLVTLTSSLFKTHEWAYRGLGSSSLIFLKSGSPKKRRFDRLTMVEGLRSIRCSQAGVVSFRERRETKEIGVDENEKPPTAYMKPLYSKEQWKARRNDERTESSGSDSASEKCTVSTSFWDRFDSSHFFSSNELA